MSRQVSSSCRSVRAASPTSPRASLPTGSARNSASRSWSRTCPVPAAQGAATSIEDAAVLARCLKAAAGDDVEGAFKRCEAHRKPRTSVQAISSANTWMREGASDTSWLYGYDAWNADLGRPAAHPRAQAA